MTRTGIVAGCVLATAIAVNATPLRTAAAQPVSLAHLPYAFDGWHGRDLPAFDPETIRGLGADQHINRVYARDAQTAAGLYVAYYAAPRPGAGIHSPLHCLPGTGWERETMRVLPVNALGGPGAAGGTVRSMLVRRDEQQAVVLYWYALNGRLVASEFKAKAFALADSWRYGLNQSALVRIVVPVTRGVSAEHAEQNGLAFMRDVHDDLARLLPAP
jgi:EpsI family protein